MAEKYRDRFKTYTAGQITMAEDNYAIDENLDGIVDYTFDKSSFNYKEFLSNLVIRWEYSPGSTLYLVWSQNRRGVSDTGELDYFRDMGDMFTRETGFLPVNTVSSGMPRNFRDMGDMFNRRDNFELNNVFLVKLSYRFGLK